jgi:hypothetical protein
VGVIIKQSVLFGSDDFDDRLSNYDIIGAANAIVLPDPVCEAIKNS